MGTNRYCKILEEDEFKATILNSDCGYHLVTFNNNTFAINKIYDDLLYEIAKEMYELCSFYRIDSQQALNLTHTLGIASIPTALLFHHGNIIAHLKGIHPKSHIKHYIFSFI